MTTYTAAQLLDLILDHGDDDELDLLAYDREEVGARLDCMTDVYDEFDNPAPEDVIVAVSDAASDRYNRLA